MTIAATGTASRAGGSASCAPGCRRASFVPVTIARTRLSLVRRVISTTPATCAATRPRSRYAIRPCQSSPPAAPVMTVAAVIASSSRILTAPSGLWPTDGSTRTSIRSRTWSPICDGRTKLRNRACSPPMNPHTSRKAIKTPTAHPMRMCQADNGPSSADETRHSAIPATRSQWKARTPRSQTRMRRGGAADIVTIATSLSCVLGRADRSQPGGASLVGIVYAWAEDRRRKDMRRAGKDAGPPERFVSGSRPDRPAGSPARSAARVVLRLVGGAVLGGVAAAALVSLVIPVPPPGKTIRCWPASMSAPAVLTRALHAADRGQKITPQREREVPAIRKGPRENPVYALQLIQDVRHILYPVQRMVADEHRRMRGIDVLQAHEERAVPGARGRQP